MDESEWWGQWFWMHNDFFHIFVIKSVPTKLEKSLEGNKKVKLFSFYNIRGV